MSKPTILTVDDDPQVSAAITRDLANQYGADYRVIRASSGREALDVVTKLALRDEALALIAADQRMPEMTGIEMLQQARTHAPGAKMLLSRRTRTPMSRSRRSTTSGSTTTCSSPGILPRNGCIRSLMTCSMTGIRQIPITRLASE
jgi:CheY-like chemotaxis protein